MKLFAFVDPLGSRPWTLHLGKAEIPLPTYFGTTSAIQRRGLGRVCALLLADVRFQTRETLPSRLAGRVPAAIRCGEAHPAEPSQVARQARLSPGKPSRSSGVAPYACRQQSGSGRRDDSRGAPGGGRAASTASTRQSLVRRQTSSEGRGICWDNHVLLNRPLVRLFIGRWRAADASFNFTAAWLCDSVCQLGPVRWRASASASNPHRRRRVSSLRHSLRILRAVTVGREGKRLPYPASTDSHALSPRRHTLPSQPASASPPPSPPPSRPRSPPTLPKKQQLCRPSTTTALHKGAGPAHLASPKWLPPPPLQGDPSQAVDARLLSRPIDNGEPVGSVRGGTKVLVISSAPASAGPTDCPGMPLLSARTRDSRSSARQRAPEFWS